MSTSFRNSIPGMADAIKKVVETKIDWIIRNEAANAADRVRDRVLELVDNVGFELQSKVDGRQTELVLVFRIVESEKE